MIGNRPKRLTAQQAQFVEAYLSSRDVEAAAEVAGYSTPYKLTGQKALRNRTVALEVEKRMARITRTTDAQYAQTQLKTVTRGDVLTRLWELASMAPLGDSQSIAGQVRACDALADVLGMKVALSADVSDMFKGKTDAEKLFFAENGYFPEAPQTVQ